jgi:hypothetical protein
MKENEYFSNISEIEYLEKIMLPEQREEGQRLAIEWQAAYEKNQKSE